MADHRLAAIKGLPTNPFQSQPAPESDVDMSESASEEQDDEAEYEDEPAEPSEPEAEPEPKHKPSRRLELPSNLDADLYGLRRSVSSSSGMAERWEGLWMDREWPT